MRIISWSMFWLGCLAIAAGVAAAPREFAGKGTVELFLSTDCPVAMQYTPRLNALYETYAAKGFAFKALFPNEMETRAGVASYMAERSYKFPADLDLGAAHARELGVQRVPTAVILDSNGKCVYMGAIDDNMDSRLVKRSYLAEALSSVVAGSAPKSPHIEPIGCLLMPGPAIPSPSKVNYAEHIAPIVNQHCVECHRSGEVAPFSLEGYDNARKWAPMMAEVAGKRKMPPWKAVHGYGDFLDENRLSETEIATLKLWNEQKAPRGDAKKEPKVPQFAGEWSLGKPDMILSQSHPYQIDGEGADDYRNFVLPLNNQDTLWVTGMDVKPGNKKVVHHVIAFIDRSNQAAERAAREKDGKEGYATFGGVGFIPAGSLGGWAPGLRPRCAPDTIAFEVPPHSSIVMQVHYHKDGKPEFDQTRLALYFAKSKPKQAMQLRWLANPLFRIPPGAKNHYVKLEYTVPADVTIYGAMPHMHLLGRTMKATVTLPDGSQKPLVYIDDWDFNWQMTYILKEPMKLPAGSRILIEATYDNSSDNRNNPNDPPRTVTWGEQTTDEMFLMVIPYTVDGQLIK